MDITVTFTGDTDSAEMAQMLKTLGIALQGGETGYDGLKTTPAVEDQTEEKPAKKTRAKAAVAKANIHEATDEKLIEKGIMKPKPEPEQVAPQTEARPSLEALSALVVAKAKEGKKTAIMKVFSEFGITRLQDADASIFVTLHEKLSAL